MKRGICRFVIFAALCIFMCICVCASDGVVVNKGEYYYSDKPLSMLPSTFEAEVKFSSAFADTERGGVILGNYDGQNVCVNFEIYTSGQPRLYIMDKKGGTAYSFVFTGVNVFNDQWTHIAIVKDSENSLAHCYINGELKQTLNAASPSSAVFTTRMILGGDRRPDNSMYMKGSIKRLALYSDVRTASEIKSDYTSDTFDTDGVLAYYKIECDENGYEPLVIEDLAGTNNFTRYAPWMKEAPELSDYAYSFAVVGDTQIMNCYNPGEFYRIYDYLTENAEENKLKFVFGLGDITDKNTALEWALAKSLITDLDGVVPYSLVRGNHDSSANFNKYMAYSSYTDKLSGTYGETIANSYQKLYIGGRKYLIFTLDFGASDDVLNWAGGIIEAHSDYNVIITTHAYLFRDGTTLDAKDVCPPATNGGYNNGDHMWDKLIKKYENIVLVLSGHDPCDNVVLTQTEGENGNIVSQMLVDPQGTDANHGASGLVAMLYFSKDGKTVQVRYYSTVREAYFKESNQFTFNIDVIEPDEAPEEEPEMEVNNISFDVKLNAESYSGKVIAVLYSDYGRVVDAKMYDAAETVNVAFDKASTGTKIKVMWWNGSDTVIPVCVNEVLELSK